MIPGRLEHTCNANIQETKLEDCLNFETSWSYWSKPGLYSKTLKKKKKMTSSATVGRQEDTHKHHGVCYQALNWGVNLSINYYVTNLKKL